MREEICLPFFAFATSLALLSGGMYSSVRYNFVCAERNSCLESFSCHLKLTASRATPWRFISWTARRFIVPARMTSFNRSVPCPISLSQGKRRSTKFRELRNLLIRADRFVILQLNFQCVCTLYWNAIERKVERLKKARSKLWRKRAYSPHPIWDRTLIVASSFAFWYLTNKWEVQFVCQEKGIRSSDYHDKKHLHKDRAILEISPSTVRYAHHVE